MNPSSRFEPVSPFPVFVGRIDEIARMEGRKIAWLGEAEPIDFDFENEGAALGAD